MNLIQSAFLVVLFVVAGAVNDPALDKSKTNVHTEDLPTVHTVTDKSQQENTVKVIVPPVSQILINTASSTTLSPPPPPTTTPNHTSTPPPPPPPAPTPAPTPTPTPTPSNDPWVIRDNITKTVCIIANMTMQLNITYPGKTQEQEHDVLKISKNATVDGSCSEPQSMTIRWGPGHRLQINFSANKTTQNFYVSGLSLDVNATVLKDVKVNMSMWHFENKSCEFMTPLNMSYKCNRVQDLSLKGENEKLKAVLSMKDIQLEAYMNKSVAGFGAAQNCDAFDTPDIVPIAVGCALAILVLVVLVAYLIGRKRSQNRGYLSM